MKIEIEKGYALYSIEEDEIIIDMVFAEVKNKGIGSKLISLLKQISIDNKLPLTLCSYPQDNSISQEDLNSFYFKNGFSLHPDDCDNTYFIWK
jgi:hypothetical protein